MRHLRIIDGAPVVVTKRMQALSDRCFEVTNGLVPVPVRDRAQRRASFGEVAQEPVVSGRSQWECVSVPAQSHVSRLLHLSVQSSRAWR